MEERIVEKREYIREIEGKIGEGDKGVKMEKGLKMEEERMKGKKEKMEDQIDKMGNVIMKEIGGYMGKI